MTIDEAIETARKYGLEYEVEYEIYEVGSSPEEVLAEWDIL